MNQFHDTRQYQDHDLLNRSVWFDSLEVAQLVTKHKIHCIKWVRNALFNGNCGLKQCKEFVESKNFLSFDTEEERERFIRTVNGFAEAYRLGERQQVKAAEDPSPQTRALIKANLETILGLIDNL
jgi:hypothetical protein